MNTGIYGMINPQTGRPYGELMNPIQGGPLVPPPPGGGGFGQPLPGIGAGQGGAQHALPSFQTFAPTPLLAQQPQGPPPPDPNGGILGAIDRVFGGPDMENLSPKARRQVRRQGLLAMAAQMLTATDPRGRRAQGLAPLGQAIFAGQQAYGQGIQQAEQQAQVEQQKKQLQELMPLPGESQGMQMYRYQKLLNLAMQNGDKASIAAIGGAIDALQNSMARGTASILNLSQPKEMLVNGKRQMLAWDSKAGHYVGLDGSIVSGDIKEPPSGSPYRPLTDQMGIYGTTQKFADTVLGRYQTDTKDVAPVTMAVDRAIAEVPRALQGDASSKALLVDAYVRYLNNNKAIREFQVELFHKMQTLQQTIEGNKIKWTQGGSNELPPELVNQMAQTLQAGQQELHETIEQARSRAVTQIGDWNAKFPEAAIDPNKYLPQLSWQGSSGGGGSGLSPEEIARMNRAAGIK